ncbi:hypothetical protein M404DRAFT_542286 [Pisolithus tinctorius Marx 270]|uniref:Uncharacterized protein n=1 Tax=Pisolithus tinctorius Marx 270 TaxID=870435 RepID=A0A0C3K5T6_PISTI|nr:hypothetical protein M404DRAFT_542286 [Pisolithus tinctorius Marx 270]
MSNSKFSTYIPKCVFRSLEEFGRRALHCEQLHVSLSEKARLGLCSQRAAIWSCQTLLRSSDCGWLSRSYL